jgi:hypothetical protein
MKKRHYGRPLFSVFNDNKQYVSKNEWIGEMLKEDKLNMGQIVVHLHEEKEVIESYSFEEGFKFGIEWALNAHHLQLAYAANKFNPHECDFEIEDVYKDNMLYPYFSKTIDSNHNTESGDNDHIPINSEQWIEGWLFGVREFWHDVSSKI